MQRREDHAAHTRESVGVHHGKTPTKHDTTKPVQRPREPQDQHRCPPVDRPAQKVPEDCFCTRPEEGGWEHEKSTWKVPMSLSAQINRIASPVKKMEGGPWNETPTTR